MYTNIYIINLLYPRKNDMNKIIDPEPNTLRGGEDKVYDVL